MSVTFESLAKSGLRVVRQTVARAAGRYFCPCCTQSVRAFDDWSPTYRNVICPRCSAHPRHRLMILYIEEMKSELREASVLHFAPEKPIRERLSGIAKKYLSADLRAAGTPYVKDSGHFLQ